ncbi:MAG: bifunctional UDP-3-O-[3-hydroxymyristoyl] N-acetylglucosamine deacetylase/3-hydroxyacyl-ACP dehydratase [Candidatus Marinimicrobia bacterium]|nr:bifunctional UDP-3-O-[3-hydroxymyristoyl] N-acetylglucosamine deacetylase/3-hydroxyacyl-ACP dehydratase [Candidatus Neomarinimicrobiota bacterium]|tara:strand:+ start:19237 stop:20589 length:1353 start_codon:yes stop_codon:yes gene_type:complete
MDKQKTISSEVSFSGIGLHTGEISNLTLKPLKENSGIIFKRIDFDEPIYIEAILENVVSTNRGTVIGKNNIKIHTIEHLLSAIYALEIDNLLIEIDNIEPPILDGSSEIFFNTILNCGLNEQIADRDYYKVSEPIYYFDDNSDIALKILPSKEFSVTFESDFPFKGIGKQKFTLNSLSEYSKDISSARTFCSLDEISYLKKDNLIKGGSLKNAVIFLSEVNTKNDVDKIQEYLGENLIYDDSSNTLNNTKLRYDDEPVRHKVLDLIGDLSLLGKPIIGHIHSYKSGHRSNVEFGKLIKEMSSDFKFNKEEIKKIIPHREPFLLIDEIIGGIRGFSVIAKKNVVNSDYFFKGHFPDNPIMPGVLIVESMAQASCFLSFDNVKNRNKKMMLLSVINSSKFIKKVIPGDELILRVKLIKIRLGTANMVGVATVNNQIVAKANFMATIVDKNNE